MDRTTRRRFQPAIDPLDRRRLMAAHPAAHVTASLSRGVLTVLGTDSADVLTVTVQGPTRRNPGGTVAVAGVPRTFRSAQVKRIEILGGAGDDVITVRETGRVTIPFRIDGGSGHNVINGVPDYPVAPIPTMPPSAELPIGPPPTVAAPPMAAPAPATPAAPAPPVEVVPLSAIEQRIVDLTNAGRQQAGLAPLSVSGRLAEAARIQSGNMARLDVMAHDLPGTAQPALTDRAAAVGYRFGSLGENIAFHYADADAVVAGWMASPGHRANILNAGFTEIGVAVAFDSQGRPYFTQVFGRPA